MSKAWPTEIIIKSRVWTIHYVPKDHPELVEGEDDYLLGCCQYPARTIHICTDQSLESMQDTLVHEMIHAWYSSIGGVDHDDEKAEENFVLNATEAFFEIVRNSTSTWWL